MRRERQERLSKGAASGLVALVFLVLGFQLAVFFIKVVERPSAAPSASEAAGESPSREPFSAHEENAQSGEASGEKTKTGGYARPTGARRTPERRSGRNYESFAFDPNTVSEADLQRLGLSERQAAAIENYRAKGGRFRGKADFQKMYVVSDTLFARLEPYIAIPKLELNAADSAALVSLRGIGPWYARKILSYRDRLGGFVDVAQLREIDGLDDERLSGFLDEVCVDTAKVRPLDLWHAPDSLLSAHPYLGPKGARSLLRYRSLYDSTRWTLTDLAREHVLPVENIEKLKKYIESQ